MNLFKLVIDAAAFAAEKHKNQRRKDNEKTPYINHPLKVAKLIIEVANVTDEVLIAAALLHDTVEDTETTYEELVERFGKEVADLVMECTDDKRLPWDVRKQEQIKTARTKSEKAKLLKLADKTANVIDVVVATPIWSLDRKLKYIDWSKKVVKELEGICPALEKLFFDAAENGAKFLAIQYS